MIFIVRCKVYKFILSKYIKNEQNWQFQFQLFLTILIFLRKPWTFYISRTIVHPPRRVSSVWSEPQFFHAASRRLHSKIRWGCDFRTKYALWILPLLRAIQPEATPTPLIRWAGLNQWQQSAEPGPAQGQHSVRVLRRAWGRGDLPVSHRSGFEQWQE